MIMYVALIWWQQQLVFDAIFVGSEKSNPRSLMCVRLIGHTCSSYVQWQQQFLCVAIISDGEVKCHWPQDKFALLYIVCVVRI